MRKRQLGTIAKGLLQRGGGRRAENTVQRLARDIRRTHALTAVPVSVLDCAASLQLPIVRTELATDGGLVDWSTSACRILLPKQAPVQLGARRRERFTIAHEIGHFVIRRYLRETVPMRVFESHSAEEEYLCNMFAGELLVPAAQLAHDAERFGLTARGILALMERYDVSLHVLGINLRHLFGAAIFLTTWTETDDGLIATCVSPSRESVELVRSEGTTIHLAALTQKEESGVDSFYVGARLARWQCWSIAIGLRRVLTVGLRADLWHRYTDQAEDQEARTPLRALKDDVVAPGLVLQTSLPFEETSSARDYESPTRGRRSSRHGAQTRRAARC